MKKKILLFCLGFFLINPFSISIATDVAGLIPCSQSSVYTKKLNSSITKLENRINAISTIPKVQVLLSKKSVVF